MTVVRLGHPTQPSKIGTDITARFKQQVAQRLNYYPQYPSNFGLYYVRQQTFKVEGAIAYFQTAFWLFAWVVVVQACSQGADELTEKGRLSREASSGEALPETGAPLPSASPTTSDELATGGEEQTSTGAADALPIEGETSVARTNHILGPSPPPRCILAFSQCANGRYVPRASGELHAAHLDGTKQGCLMSASQTNHDCDNVVGESITARYEGSPSAESFTHTAGNECIIELVGGCPAYPRTVNRAVDHWGYVQSNAAQSALGCKLRAEEHHTWCGQDGVRAYSLGVFYQSGREVSRFTTSRRIQGELIVSPNGDDNAAGTLDAPLRTWEGARQRVRQLVPSQSGDIYVYFRGGVHTLGATVTLTPEDSGRFGYDVVYTNYPGESAAITAGRRITGWAAESDGVWSAHVEAGFGIRTLFVNSWTAPRARHPNEGQNLHLRRVARRTIISTIPGLTDLLTVEASIFPSDPKSIPVPGAELVVTRMWDQERILIDYVQNDAQIAVVYPQQTDESVMMRHPDRVAFYSENLPVHYENDRRYVDSAGEWFHDWRQNKLYYFPRFGEDPNASEIYAGSLETLVSLAGRNRADPVHNVLIEGLVFQYSDWKEGISQAYIGAQASVYHTAARSYVDRPSQPPIEKVIPSAIKFRHVRTVAFKDNILAHLGGSGLELGFSVEQIEISGNFLADIGGSGIVFNCLGYQGIAPEDTCEYVHVADNYIRFVGQTYTGSVGLFAPVYRHSTIEHNDFRHLPYTAISSGWGWGDLAAALKARLGGNFIVNNNIQDIMRQHVDGGGIYTLDEQPNTLISGNYIHDWNLPSAFNLIPYRMPSGGHYLDNGSKAIRAQHNIVARVPDGYFLQNSVGVHATYNAVNQNYTSDVRYTFYYSLSGALPDLSNDTPGAGFSGEAGFYGVFPRPGRNITRTCFWRGCLNWLGRFRDLCAIW